MTHPDKMTQPVKDDARPAPGPANDPITGPVILPQSGEEMASEDNSPESDDDEGS